MTLIFRHARVFLFLAAFLPRLALPAIGFSGVTGDSTMYIPMAEGLVSGAGYVDADGAPTAQRSPAYPTFLAGMLALSGGSMRGAQILQGALAAMIAPLLFDLALPFLGPRRALVAGLVFALDVVSVPASAYILTEAIGSALLLLWVSSWFRCLRMGGAVGYAWSGLLGGVLMFQTMITMLLHPIALGLDFLLHSRLRKRVLLSALLFLIPLTAWMLRNRAVLGEGTSVRTGGYGFLLWATVNYDFPWLLSPYDERGSHIFKQRDHLSDHSAEGHVIYKAKAIRRILVDPPAAVWRMMKAEFWAWVEVPGAMKTLDSKPIVKMGLRAWNIGVILAAIVSLPWALGYREGRVAFGAVLYFSVFLAPLFPIPRYFLPIRPLLAFLAAHVGKGNSDPGAVQEVEITHGGAGFSPRNFRISSEHGLKPAPPLMLIGQSRLG